MEVSAQAVAILVFSFRAPALKSLSARVLKHLPDRGRIGKTRGRKHRCISKKRWPEARVFRASPGSLPASPLGIRVPEVLAQNALLAGTLAVIWWARRRECRYAGRVFLVWWSAGFRNHRPEARVFRASPRWMLWSPCKQGISEAPARNYFIYTGFNGTPRKCPIHAGFRAPPSHIPFKSGWPGCSFYRR